MRSASARKAGEPISIQPWQTMFGVSKSSRRNAFTKARSRSTGPTTASSSSGRPAKTSSTRSSPLWTIPPEPNQRKRRRQSANAFASGNGQRSGWEIGTG